jgi:hypothetical protein
MNLGDGCDDEDGRETRSFAHLDLHIVSATGFFLFSFFLFSQKKSQREKIIF